MGLWQTRTAGERGVADQACGLPECKRRSARVLAVAALGLLLAACGADSFESGDAGFGRPAPGWDGAPQGSDDDAGWEDGLSAASESAMETGGAEGPADEPFEEEEDTVLKLDPPTAAGRYVYVMDPALGLVARIDSVTLAVRPIRVGDEPVALRANPDRDLAVVLNRGSATLSIVEAAGEADRIRHVPVLRNANALELSPDGRWAAVYYDNRTAGPDDRVGSLQEVALVRIVDGEVFYLTVGFAPRAVRFDRSGERMIVVSREGINVLTPATLVTDTIVPLIEVDAAAPFDFEPEQVVLDPVGRFALVRRTDAAAAVYHIDLATLAVQRLPLPSPPSDVRLVRGGASALVALRGEGVLLDVPVPEGFASGDAIRTLSFDGVPVGRVEPVANGQEALLYTTLGGDRRVGIADLAPEEAAARLVTLRKPIAGVASTPRADRALVVHPIEPPVQGDTPAEATLRSSDAVSVLDLVSGYARLIVLPNPPLDVVWSADQAHAFLLLADRDSASVEWIELGSLRTRTLTFDATPETIGVVPSTNRVFITLASEGGRIVFLDPSTGERSTVSSYTLNAFIE